MCPDHSLNGFDHTVNVSGTLLCCCTFVWSVWKKQRGSDFNGWVCRRGVWKVKGLGNKSEVQAWWMQSLSVATRRINWPSISLSLLESIRLDCASRIPTGQTQTDSLETNVTQYRLLASLFADWGYTWEYNFNHSWILSNL